MTKKDKACLYSYRQAQYHSVNEAYDRPSTTKQAIEQHILQDMILLNGYGYKVCSKNCFHFTAGFLFKSGGKEHLMYYTHARTEDIIIDENNQLYI